MPVAHAALLGELLALRCDSVTFANGYDWQRTRVVRASMTTVTNYEHGVIEVIEGDPQAETDANANLNVYPWIGWTQDFLVHVVIIQPQASETPLVDEVGLSETAVVKGIAPSQRLSNQVHTLNLVSLEQFRAAPGEQGGVLIHLRATYQTHEDQLDVTPYAPLPAPPPGGP